MKTIFISISRGSLIRNFFQTGVVSRILEQGIRVVCLTPNYQDKELFKDFEHSNLILEPLINAGTIKYRHIIQELLKAASFNKTVFIRYLYRFSGSQPSWKLFLPRMLVVAGSKLIPNFKKIVRWLDFKINPQTEHDYLFNKYKPELAFITTPHADPDVGVLKSAKRFKIKTAQMPKSWDNPSKILYNVKADFMIIWSQFMLEQSVKYQGYKKQEIIISGAPQFDWYAKKDRLLTRQEFCQQFDFDPNKKIILYGSTGGNCFSEADYLHLIKKFIDHNKLKDVQVLIRPHLGYLGDDEKFKNLEKYPGFKVDRTDKQTDKFKDHWDISKNHLDHLFNSLYHADVCINIASTLTLDAAACQTPVININFDVQPDIKYKNSVKRFYITDYISAITKFGATWLVKNKQEFLEALKKILEQDKQRQQASQDLIKYFAYQIDGQSAKRIADSLISIINK